MPRTLAVQSSAIPLFLGEPALEPVRLSGRDGLNSLFKYELLLKTPDALNIGASNAADFDLDAFIGREISCRLELDGAGIFVAGTTGTAADHLGAGERQINAIVTEAAVWGEEGRHVQYRLTLRPWLHLATLSTDCRIFQDKTVEQILDELLADYDFPVEKRLFDTYPIRDYQVQYNEPDFEFFERLCQEWGISYHFEHSEGRHRLVLSDAMAAYRRQENAAYQQVDYHAPGWKTDAEYIHRFEPVHRLTSGRFTSRDYDYMRPRADLTATRKDPRPTGQADGEVYQFHAPDAAGSHYAQPRAGAPGNANDTPAEARQLALLRMQALRTQGARAQAGGNLRGMVPGHTFTLQKHPRARANAEYLVLDTRFLIEDIGQESQPIGAGGGRSQQWRVEAHFTVHPVTEPLRPDLVRPKPRCGPVPAVVVGPAGENIWTDELGRIKVKFPWDRRDAADPNSSCWLRVSSPWAGNQLGAIQLPRIGQEVTVDFFGGDPDQPFCAGQVYNQANTPPWALPAQQALSGFRTRGLVAKGGNSAAGQSNNLTFDDTAGKMQVQLRSDHQHSQLSLGHITRIEDNAGRKDPRGEGVELRTDGHGVMRAMAGVLISTEPRPAAERHITDMGETVARLGHARKLHDNLCNAALQAEAQDGGDQDAVVGALQKQNEAIQGSGTFDAESGRFPELDQPHLVLASAAGIETSSAQSTHVHAADHIALTSGGHTSFASDKSLLASARHAIRFFAHASGMRWVAHKGDIVVKAIRNSIRILANLEVTVSADTIAITARKKLTLNGGGSIIALDASGIRETTPGPHRVFAAVHGKVGPSNAPVDALDGRAHLKETEASPGYRSFVLRSHPEDGHLLAREPYTLYRDGVEVEKGFTDDRGRIDIELHQGSTAKYKLRFTNGSEIEVPVAARLQQTDERLAAQGFRAAQGHARDRMRHFKHRRGDEQS